MWIALLFVIVMYSYSQFVMCQYSLSVAKNPHTHSKSKCFPVWPTLKCPYPDVFSPCPWSLYMVHSLVQGCEHWFDGVRIFYRWKDIFAQTLIFITSSVWYLEFQMEPFQPNILLILDACLSPNKKQPSNSVLTIDRKCLHTFPFWHQLNDWIW